MVEVYRWRNRVYVIRQSQDGEYAMRLLKSGREAPAIVAPDVIRAMGSRVGERQAIGYGH